LLLIVAVAIVIGCIVGLMYRNHKKQKQRQLAQAMRLKRAQQEAERREKVMEGDIVSNASGVPDVEMGPSTTNSTQQQNNTGLLRGVQSNSIQTEEQGQTDDSSSDATEAAANNDIPPPPPIPFSLN